MINLKYVFFFVVVWTKLTYSSNKFVSMSIFIIYMIEKVQKSVHDNKTLGLKNPIIYVLTDNCLKPIWFYFIVI